MLTDSAKSTFAGVLDRGSFFLFTLILARNASLEVLGLFSFLLVVVNVVVNPLTFAINSTYTRKLAEMEGENLSQVLFENVVLCLTVLTIAVAGVLTANAFLTVFLPDVTNGLLISCFFLAVTETLRKSMVGICIGLADFTAYIIAASTFSLVLNFYILQVESIGVQDAILAHAVGSLASGVGGCFWVVKKRQLHSRGL